MTIIQMISHDKHCTIPHFHAFKDNPVLNSYYYDQKQSLMTPKLLADVSLSFQGIEHSLYHNKD